MITELLPYLNEDERAQLDSLLRIDPLALAKYRDDPVGFGENVLSETYTRDVKKVMESVRDNEVTIAVSANGVGKTHCAARLAWWFYLTRTEVQIYTAAAPPEDNLRRLLWGEINSVAAARKELAEGNKITGLNVQRAPQQFITGVTIPTSGDPKTREAKFSGKHAPSLMFIFDEGDAIPDEVYAGRETCTSGGEFRTLIMFNPRQPKGEAYRMIRDGRANVVSMSAFRHPNVSTGETVIPGAVDRNTTARRIHQMCRHLKDGETAVDVTTFNLPYFLVGFQATDQKGKKLPKLKAGKYKVLTPAFSHMVLGEYPAHSDDQLISQEWIFNARSRWDLYVSRYGEVPPPKVDGVAGLDPGEFGADPSVLIERYAGWVPMPIQWHGVDVLVTADKAKQNIAGKPIKCINVDANGVGAGTPPMLMRNGVTAQAVKTQETKFKKENYFDESELGEFKIYRDCLAWQVREWLRADAGAMLPPDEELLEELRIPTYKIEGKYIRTMAKDTMKDLLKRSPNKFDALALTFAKPLNRDNSLRVNAAKAAQLKRKYSRYGGG